MALTRGVHGQARAVPEQDIAGIHHNIPRLPSAVEARVARLHHRTGLAWPPSTPAELQAFAGVEGDVGGFGAERVGGDLGPVEEFDDGGLEGDGPDASRSVDGRAEGQDIRRTQLESFLQVVEVGRSCQRQRVQGLVFCIRAVEPNRTSRLEFDFPAACRVSLVVLDPDGGAVGEADSIGLQADAAALRDRAVGNEDRRSAFVGVFGGVIEARHLDAVRGFDLDIS